MEDNSAAIKCEYSVTWKRYVEWWLESKVKPPRLIFAVMWIVLGIIGIGLGIVIEAGKPLYFFMVLFCIYRVAPRDILVLNRQYKAMAKSFGREEWLRTVIFEEEQIVMLEGNVTMNFRYSDISAVKEKGNKVWLALKDKKAIRLYRDCFVNADWDECRSLIRRRIAG